MRSVVSATPLPLTPDSSKGIRRNGALWACALQGPDGLWVLFLLSRNRRFATWPFFSFVFKTSLILCGFTYRTIKRKNPPGQFTRPLLIGP